MKLLILGATGRVGREMVRLALQDGHDVTALVRSVEKSEALLDWLKTTTPCNATTENESSRHDVLPETNSSLLASVPNLKFAFGDARSRSDVSQAVTGADAVLCSLNTDGGTVLSESMAVILDVMRENGIRRIVSIGTAGILQARSEPHLLRYRSSETRRTTTAAAEDHERAYRMLASTENLDWTLVCPTYLPEGAATGHYRVEREVLPEGGMRITTGDTAVFAYGQLQSEEFLRCRVGIAE
ncbi:NAD(P)-dependent oxidoreductase [Tumebacillus flagellatus]|uniref:NAD(P)-binding domain-containing protein n=1 Tax=Tumebacillus flagellatus TaxID=1157490 RepID=A0A074LW81_9BACL|nr:NAD(P)H-binding protein [Tumebacillus flagellatus]KEO84845.1 hypothetical protein EL26_02215 [Tumebacillus flagellatus]